MEWKFVRCDFPDFNDPHGIEYNLLNLFINTLGVKEVMNTTTFQLTHLYCIILRRKGSIVLIVLEVCEVYVMILTLINFISFVN